MIKSINKISEEDIVSYRAAICKTIQQKRIAKGWNQGNLADAIGIKRTHISRIESGKYNFTLDNLLLIMKALGIKRINLDVDIDDEEINTDSNSVEESVIVTEEVSSTTVVLDRHIPGRNKKSDIKQFKVK